MAKEENEIDNSKLEKLKILQSTLDKIEKNYGKGSIMKLGDRPEENLEVIPTGSISRSKRRSLNLLRKYITIYA